MKRCSRCHVWQEENRFARANATKLHAYCKPCMAIKCRDWKAKRGYDYNVILKDKCFAAYGGYRCKCCGETEKKFLTLDHINNDGATHRKQGLMGGHFHWWLHRNKFPPGIQVLCMNCNFGKALNNGICPHQTKLAKAAGKEQPRDH